MRFGIGLSDLTYFNVQGGKRRGRRRYWGGKHDEKEGCSHFQWHVHTPPSSSYTQLSSYKDKNALPKYDVTCHEFNHFQPCVTFYQDVKVVRRTYPRREATTQTDENEPGHGADDSTEQVQPHIPKVGGDIDIKTRAVVKLVFKRLKSRPMTPVRKPLGMYFIQPLVTRERAIDIESPPMAPLAKPLGRCKGGQF